MHEFETLAHEIIQYMGDTLKVSKDFGQVDDIVFDFFTENRGLQLVISAVR